MQTEDEQGPEQQLEFPNQQNDENLHLRLKQLGKKIKALEEENRRLREINGRPTAAPACVPESAVLSAVLSRRNTEHNLTETYEKLPGTSDDSGHLFEIKMALLVALRCLGTGKPFRMASNMKGAGKFDDLVVEQEGSFGKVCIQLKHTKNHISSNYLLAFSGKFSVLTYFISYRDEICKKLGQDFSLVLYTNAEMSDEFFHRGENNDLLNTSSIGSSFFFTDQDVEIYEMPQNIELYKTFLMELDAKSQNLYGQELSQLIHRETEKYYNQMSPFYSKIQSLKTKPTKKCLQKLLTELRDVGDLSVYHDFLGKFKVYCKQASEEELDGVIKAELKTQIGFCETDETFANLLEDVRHWWKRKDAHYLNQTDPMWLTASHKLFHKLSEPKLKEISKLAMKVRDETLYELRGEMSCARLLHIYVNGDCTSLATCKVQQALEGGDDVPAIFVSLTTALDERDSVLGAWRSRWGRTLVLEVNSEGADATDLFSEMANILQENDEKKLVVITNIQDLESTKLVKTVRGDKYSSWKETTSLFDLTEDTQRHLMNRRLAFQGQEVTLYDVLNQRNELKKAIYDENLLKLLKRKLIRIGEDISEVLTYYIPRTLVREGVSHNVEDPTAFQDRVVIVMGEPGMGKSTLMTYLARRVKETYPCTWVVRANLNDHTQLLDSMRDSDIDSNSTIVFLKAIARINNRSSALDKSMFDYCWQASGKIIIFLDGFDEIFPTYKTSVIQIIKNLLKTDIDTIWITSRVLCKEVILNAVNSESFHIAPFKESEKKMFLTQVWGKEIPNDDIQFLTDFVGRFLEAITSTLNDVDKSFTDIPLHLSFFAELFKDQVQQIYRRNLPDSHLRLDILQLYEEFFKRKCLINFKEKRGYDITKKDTRKHYQTFQRKMETVHKACSLVALFSEDQLKSISDSTFEYTVEDFLGQVKKGSDLIGVIKSVENGKPIFIHRSFAEYFAAKWFSENYQYEEHLFKKMLRNPSFYFVLTMFNKILSKSFPLHLSVINGDYVTFKSLLERADVNQRDIGGRTALHLAAGIAHEDSFTNILLHHGADVNVNDNVLGWTAMRYADAARMWSSMDLLLDKGGDSSDLVVTKMLVHDEGTITSVLRECFQHSCEAILLWLLANGIAINATVGVEQHTPLYIAASCMESPVPGKEENDVRLLNMTGKNWSIEFLLRYGADVNFRSSNGQTLLHCLAESSNVRAIRYIMERDEEDNDDVTTSPTERLLAILQGKTDKILTQKFMSRYKDDSGKTALDVAVECGNEDVVKYLRDTKLPLNSWIQHFDNVDYPQIVCAVRFLVEEKGADICVKDAFGKTLLHLAAKGGYMFVVKYLLKRGASVSVVDSQDNNLLHESASAGHLDVATYLIEECGSDLNARNGASMTPLCYACMEGKLEMVKYLVEKGSDICVKDELGKSLMHHSAKCGNIHVIMYLVAKGADVRIRDNQGNTALHECARNGHLDVATYLIEDCGCDPKSRNARKKTPIYYAFLEGHLEMVKYLDEHFTVKVN